MKQIKGRTDFDKLVTCTSFKKIIYIKKKPCSVNGNVSNVTYVYYQSIRGINIA